MPQESSFQASSFASEPFWATSQGANGLDTEGFIKFTRFSKPLPGFLAQEPAGNSFCFPTLRVHKTNTLPGPL